MNENYKLLPIAPKVFKTLAWAGGILGIISGVIIFLGMDSDATPRVMGFAPLIAGMIYFFVFFTIAELIHLLLELHEKMDS